MGGEVKKQQPIYDFFKMLIISILNDYMLLIKTSNNN